MGYLRIIVFSLIICIFVFRDVAGGVSKCYSCVYDCQNPAILSCPKAPNGDLSCTATKLNLGGKVVEFRGCILSNDSDFKTSCDDINRFPNESCYVCDKDLCNLL